MPGDRLEKGLAALVDTFGRDLPKDKHAEALQRARSLLKEHQGDEHTEDYGQLADLIKKRFWREHNNPDAAVKFGNLYSRFLSNTALTRRQSVLWLVYRLADGGDESATTSIESLATPHSRNGTHSDVQDDMEGTDPNKTPQASRRLDSTRTASNDSPRQSHTSVVMPLAASSDDDDTEIANGMDDEDSLKTPVTELNLLRDLPFTLQGLSSSNLKFDTKSALALPRQLPLPMLSILYRLAEPCLLYRDLSDFIQSPHSGLISQSLRAVIGIEMRSYLGLIATLEGEIRRTIAATNEDNNEAKKAAVTLRRCVVWTRDATMGLRLMSTMAAESQSKTGGQLISLIHSYTTSYGDPFVNSFADRMLAHLSQPFYDMLRQWIYDGELHDPYREFFVTKHDAEEETMDLGPRRLPASSVWEAKYKLESDLTPSIVTDDLARKVFLIGKSLNFIRHGCSDSDWVDTYSKDSSQELRYGDTAGLEASIDRAYKTTMARLMELMNTKFNLSEHLLALKKYLLLGQGDFVALLMESLAANLDRPAGSQYRHTLTAQLDHAIRGSSASYDSAEVRQRLDARLLELSHGDIGWDVFTLEYKIDPPVDVVITGWASKQYLKVFNFLWRTKRVEYTLGTTWRRLMTGARGVLAGVDGSLARQWKATRCCIAEMIHFVSQLQNYILFEVIEASWNKLQAAMSKPDYTLDDLIAAHTAYLNDITHKGLLGAGRSVITGSREDSFMAQLHHLLKAILAYKDAVDGLFSYSVAEFTKRQALAVHASQRGSNQLGDGGLDSPLPGDRLRGKHAKSFSERDTDSPVPTGPILDARDDEMLPALQKRLQELAVEFRSRLAVLLGDLSQQSDPDIKFLGMNMNFNDVYRPQRRKKREKEGSDTQSIRA